MGFNKKHSFHIIDSAEQLSIIRKILFDNNINKYKAKIIQKFINKKKNEGKKKELRILYKRKGCCYCLQPLLREEKMRRTNQSHSLDGNDKRATL